MQNVFIQQNKQPFFMGATAPTTERFVRYTKFENCLIFSNVIISMKFFFSLLMCDFRFRSRMSTFQDFYVCVPQFLCSFLKNIENKFVKH